MTPFLPADSLKEIRRCINQTLMDTFQMMFYLDVFLLPSLTPFEKENVICSFVEMKNENVKAALSIMVTQELAEHLALKMDPTTSPPEPAIVQDLVSEVCNIIGNRVRSYIHDKIGVNLVIGLPKMGQLTKTDEAAHSLRLHFRLRQHDKIALDFIYMPQLRRA